MKTLITVFAIIAGVFCNAYNTSSDLSPREVGVDYVLNHYNARDVDGDSLGVAILAASDAIEYSLNDGMSWLTLSTPSDNNALLLDAENDLRFSFDRGVPWMRIRAWDQTVGTIGTLYAITGVGGETAFSETAVLLTAWPEAADATVDEDLRLPITYKALSRSNYVATLTDITYTIDPPEIGTWQPREAADDPKIAGHFRPTIPGTCILTVRGKNSRGLDVTPGTLTIQVLAGPAERIVVEALAPVQQ